MPAGLSGTEAVQGTSIRRRQALLCAAAGVALAAALSVTPAEATPAPDPSVITLIATPAVGGTVINPLTGLSETVVQVLSPVSVLTSNNNTILLANAVNDTFVVGSLTYTVTAVHVNAVTGVVDQVTVQDNQSTPVTSVVNRVVDQSGALVIPPLSGGDAGASLNPVSAPGDFNYADNRRGGNGGNGRDGGGVEICPPLVGCFTIGVDPESGGDGSAGPTINTTLTADYSSISNNLSAVSISSIGGDGGTGGDGYLAVDGRPGGSAGAGGPVTVNVSGTLATSGAFSHGLFVQSRSGVGGEGGTGYIFGSGGGGGPAGQGGTVNVTFSGVIGTSGIGSMGILAQSLGGAAGGGGDSYGVIGSAASGSTGGNGGSVTVDTYGVIHTTGNDAHGILAQSIGGSGGASGNAGGIVAFGDDGGLGGNGGAVTLTAHNGSVTTTTGILAFGLFAQSIGGGGGAGGFGAGLVGLGSGGGSAGDGGAVNLTVESGASVTTTGAGGVALFAQSTGGGGGVGGTGAGIVGLGADGASGGTGGAVTVNSSGQLHTSGIAGFGVVAMSVGGGGGAALGTGGLVALGGSGGAGSSAGAVTVNLGAGGSITTEGFGATGVYAQSTGGGGGLGSPTGGVVALGGTGGSGGDGGLVTVTNAGLIETQGDLARGIFALSVGGGGGAGGASGGLVTIGGTGGGSSFGGQVTLTNTGQVTTHGNFANAIQAQSIGGGGGDGGSTGGVFLTIGGGGTAGGDAGLVTVNHAGFISTHGSDSDAIFAQSVGGGGGNGGSTVSVSAFAGVAIGGGGGLGGDGGQVDLNLSQSTILVGGVPTLVNPQIVTVGDRSRGIFAQSVGGGGGNGGFAAQVAAGYGGSASIAVGGSGGDGGAGGLVTVDGDVSILTQGDNSEAFFAQSVGGGGGSGGFAVSFSFAAGETAAAALSVGVGGSGGDGGAGGQVTVNSGGAINTEGEFSTGFIAQSVGGGGGNGGFSVSVSGSAAGVASASIGVGVGGSGGDGGLGGTVDAAFDGTIFTVGDSSGGALIQSVGGGGGNGGFNVTAAVSASGTAAAGAAVGVGGSGGDGGDAGAVTGHIGGFVQTEGDLSTGVIVQSVGGGGGRGGFNVSGAIGASGSYAGGISVGVGGSGGGGGDGGTVDASALAINTFGDQSGGFLAQSLGGGGGNGGFNVSGSIGVGGSFGAGVSVGVGGAGGDGGLGRRVTATVTGNVTTHGADSDAIIAQSIGGGGGSGGFNVAGAISASNNIAGSISVGVGGSGGGGGGGGEVNLTVVGTTRTDGARADGIIAQSVGGGGGSGGFNGTGNIALAGTTAGTVGVGVGGVGGDGGDAGAVTLNVNTGVADPDGLLLAVVTNGLEARGIVAQSLGGGGGNGGFNVTGGIGLSKTGAGNIGVGVGGGGGDGGDAGDVAGWINGDVATQGTDASGVLVQSVGGGGGNGGFNVSGGIAGAQSAAGNLLVGVGGFGGGGGNSGAVTGGITGDVETHGDGAFAVTYQSLGGSGGNGAFNVTGGIALSVAGGGGAGNIGVGVGGFGGDGGDGSSVDASIIGNIFTAGDDAHGVLLQSAGGGGGTGAFNITGGITASSGVSGTVGFGLGGFGGGAGAASTVNGVLTGDVTTLGDNSFGAMLQSLGGAGGAGGMNITGAVSVSVQNSASVAVGLGVGGFGGGGGNASTVTGVVTGNYTTSGNDADGVVAQSIGGGGGAGGLNVSGAIALGLGTTGTGTLGIGGFGGAGGSAGAVNFTRVGDTATNGTNADGLIIQSVGGGGGAGGINVSGGISATTSGNAGSLGLGLGGFGGGGGDGGNVSATVTGNVWAQGYNPIPTLVITDRGDEDPNNDVTYQSWADGSHGVIVQSVGGGGGAGGLSVTGDISISTPGAGPSSRAASIGIGGFGGSGGDAGTANLTMHSAGTARIQAQASGDDRYAVAVQSIGGGGGAGGLNVAGAIAADGSLTIGLGGFGGGGGLGRDVTADVDADLFAFGHGARGLLVQSVGGGGGAGGININGSVTYDPSTKEPAVALGLGGFGGAGNAAGDVDAVQHGQVMVQGADTVGVLVQSVGGGGGSGGLNVSASGTGGSSNPSRTSGYALAVGVGGAGGSGADGGTVDLRSVGNIFMNTEVTSGPGGVTYTPTLLASSGVGLMAQSVGGGGGVGGINAAGAIAPNGSPLVVGVGGTGGPGGAADTVTVVRGYDLVGGSEVAAAGVIVTHGANSTGLIAQSVGGGGGAAGMNFTVPLRWAETTNTPFAAVINVGGSAGDGGDAGDVSVRHLGDIITRGDRSEGIFAQSVGGGGGSTNLNLGLGRIKDATGVRLTVGGENGDGGIGQDVSVEHSGVISTVGADASGIRAQSLGGGGGSVFLDMILAISAANTLDISIGRQGGAGGEAGDVTVDAEGLISTNGARSYGIFAQSVGGGGGASSATSVGFTHTTNPGTPDAQSTTVNVAVGIEGGVGAVGGDVHVDSDAVITTRGSASHAIFAQSIGGGGGVGGSAGTAFVADSMGLGLNFGGAGGTGALSGDVFVTHSGDILTTGEKSVGIMAQAVGGGGGMGGHARTIDLGGLPVLTPTTAVNNSFSLNIGGTGGTGAVGGHVEVTNTGTIETRGLQSHGIWAQSIGGGGGNGGASLNVRLQGPRTSNSVGINIGGTGGTGGAGGTVDVINEGLIVTRGQGSAGIMANSIGGGGGDGGIVLDAVVGAGAGGNRQSHRFSFNFGGSGGTGGVGGTVHVINRPLSGQPFSGEIYTFGQDAYGVFAQSLGGGGGNGSSVISLTVLARGSRDDGSFSLSLGGSGGSGNTGGAVTVDNFGLIDTTGQGSHGILAQSIGGGGGNGGIALAGALMISAPTHSPLVTIGGTGGDGGDGGTVTVNNVGNIVTRGARADGIVAQSIGGGGGNAQMGFSLSGEPISFLLSNTLSGIIGATGGGNGGTGGQVIVNHSGNITVLGDGSTAIRAESLNGGGGSLTLDFSGITGLPGLPIPGGNQKPKIEVRAGGHSVSGSNAGSVTVNTTGSFGAAGANGAGILNQAVGGGGGNTFIKAAIGAEVDDPTAGAETGIEFDLALGGVDGTDNRGGDIVSGHTGQIITTGVNTPGVLIQSIGGGGGRSVLDLDVPDGALIGQLSLELGGRNGHNERGGDVDRTQSGAILTTGAIATGAILQSIGGGGGSASIALHGAGSTGAPATVSLGSDGGSGLDGGAVTGHFSGGVETTGAHAIALFAQSVGAGGGEVRLTGVGALGVTLGGSNGASGNGGAISLTNSGDIFTHGAGAHGVFLQSVGGGGGAVFGFDGTPTLTLSHGGVGDGGAISFVQTGDISVAGPAAFGIVAQSLGGGGGWIDGAFAGSAGGAGHGGAINLVISGQVFAPGAGSSAVLAQSLGSAGAGDITLVADGLIRGGAGPGAGVRFEGGANNIITSSGSISAVSGRAVDTGTGNDQVVNHGLMIGDVDLGSGANAFNNAADGTFIAYHTIDLRDGPPKLFHTVMSGIGADVGATALLGPTATFTNDGDFLMGLAAARYPIDLAAGASFYNFDGLGDPSTNLLYGARVINTVALDGNYVQSATGFLAFDVAFGPYASDRVNVTGDATVNGTGQVILTWMQDRHPVTLFATVGSGFDNGLNIEDTLAVDYGILANGDGVHLTIATNFGQPFLNRNERALGRHMDSAMTVGGSAGIGRLGALLGNMQSGDEALYTAVMTELDPSPHVAPLATQLDQANSFGGDLFGCASAVTTTLDGQCVWTRFYVADADQDASFENFQVERASAGMRGGFQKPMDGPWSLAVAIGYEQIGDISIDNGRARTSGNGMTAGIGVQRRGEDGLSLGYSLSGGWNWLKTDRRVNVFTPGVGHTDVGTGYLQARFDVAELARAGALFAKPSLGVTVTALHHNGLRESGLDGLGVVSDGNTQVIAAVEPELTFGAVLKDDADYRTVLSFSVGGRYASTDELDLPVRFIGAGAGAHEAVMSNPYDQSAWTASAGLSIAGRGPVTLNLNYTGEYGTTGERHRGGLDLKFRF